MVLEFLLDYELGKPLNLFASGFFFSTIAIFISATLFSHAPSIAVVTFMTLPLVYVYTNLLQREAAHEVKDKKVSQLLDDNMFLAKAYIVLFLGMTTGVAFWFGILPESTITTVFSEQLYNLGQIGFVTGLPAASAVNTGAFMTIAENNIKLVLLSAVLSFVFAAGALFILSWNASIVGVAVGSIIVKLKAGGAIAFVALFKGIGLGTVFYILHLVPEVIAYFFAAVAGAFISSALMRYKPMSTNSKRLLAISAALLLFSIILILIAALVEIQISHQLQLAYGV